jgi:hypothetical protein
VTELVNRIIVLENKENQNQDAAQLTQRSNRPTQILNPAELTEHMNDLTIKVDCYLARLEDMETIVE